MMKRRGLCVCATRVTRVGLLGLLGCSRALRRPQTLLVQIWIKFTWLLTPEISTSDLLPTPLHLQALLLSFSWPHVLESSLNVDNPFTSYVAHTIWRAPIAEPREKFLGGITQLLFPSPERRASSSP